LCPLSLVLSLGTTEESQAKRSGFRDLTIRLTVQVPHNGEKPWLGTRPLATYGSCYTNDIE